LFFLSQSIAVQSVDRIRAEVKTRMDTSHWWESGQSLIEWRGFLIHPMFFQFFLATCIP